VPSTTSAMMRPETIRAGFAGRWRPSQSHGSAHWKSSLRSATDLKPSTWAIQSEARRPPGIETNWDWLTWPRRQGAHGIGTPCSTSACVNT
jgi:hypothetical protein